MFYSVELLSLRKKGKLARCWLAATLSDRQFRKAVSNKVVMSIDLQVTCEEILKYVVTDRSEQSARFSLYMSAQLVYGSVKLLKIQATLFHDSLHRIRTDLKPVDLMSKKRRRTSEVSVIDDLTLPDLPPVAFKNVHLTDDLHLLPEVDLQTIEQFKTRHHVEDMYFGALTENEVDWLLRDDFRMCLTPRGSHLDGIDQSREQHRAAEYTEETQNLGLSDRLVINEESAGPRGIVESAAGILTTPQKRRSTATGLETPTKRLRRGLGPEIDATAERTTTVDQPLDIFADSEVRLVDKFADPPADVTMPPVDKSVGFPPEDAALPPQEDLALPVQEDRAFPAPEDSALPRQEDSALPVQEDSAHPAQDAPALAAQESTVNVTAPADSNLHLEISEQAIPIATTSRRGRKNERIDLDTQLLETGKSKFSKPDVYTTPCVPPVPERKRGMLAAALFANPTTIRSRHRTDNSSKWAPELLCVYKMRIKGPFEAENDASMSYEVIRLAESAMHSGLDELSKRPEDTTAFESSSQNKTAEPIPVGDSAIADLMMPHVPEVPEVPAVPEAIVLADISNEPIFPNASEAPEANVVPEIDVPPVPQNVPEIDDPPVPQNVPEFDVPPVPQNVPEISSGTATMSVANLRQSDFRESATTNGQSTSDTNTGDVDAFLPPKLRRKRSAEKKSSLEKSSSRNAIVDISESPVSVRSRESIGQSTWSKPELLAYLEVLWYNHPIAKLIDLLPTDSTRRVDAAVCFTLLLELFNERKVDLKQREPYGPILIAKMTGGRRVNWDEA